MATTYRWYGSLPRADRTSATALGFPWLAIDTQTDEPVVEVQELAASTADGILAEVGTDPVKAQRALDAENARDKPRVTLTRKLARIVEDAP